jgi:hypothetical protein
MPVEFQATWCGTGLGAYRPCPHTYERYPYSSVPILDDARFTGVFDWIHAPDTIDPVKVARVEDLNRQLAAVGLALPQDFLTFHSRSALSGVLDAVSVTGCWSSLSEQPIPSPAEPGAFLVRFLNDQQDCATWYLYLRPSGDSFVVHAYGLEFPVDDEETPAYRRPGAFPAYLDPGEYEEFARIYWCAPSFEEFVYRFWIENRLCRALQSVPEEPLPPELEDYVAYYRHSREVRSS